MVQWRVRYNGVYGHGKNRSLTLENSVTGIGVAEAWDDVQQVPAADWPGTLHQLRVAR